MLTAQELAQYIGIDAPPAWEHCFAAAMEGFRPQWLQEIDFGEILRYYEFTEPFYYDTLDKAIPMICEDEKLDRICWLIHYILYYAAEFDREAIYSWGKGGTPFKDHGSNVICVIALLAGQPIHAENMRCRHYDEAQIAFHKTGIRNTWMGEREDYGYDGISFRLMAWGIHYIQCALVRLGRLIYQYAPNKYPEYKQELGEDVCIIDLHIPGSNNGLQDSEVTASFQLAKERLVEYFPEARGKTIAIAVSTWLLSPQLRQILKPESNIIKFQNHFHVTKLYEGTQSFLINIFHITDPVGCVDLTALPEDTHLRAAVKKILQEGGTFQNGKGYFICQ